MSLIRRVVFDTSTLIGAALKQSSVPQRALHLALARHDVCASVQTWVELERVLLRKRFDRYLERQARQEFVALLRGSMHFFAVTPADASDVQPPCRDPMDNKFLALVQVCQADILVSSCDDLLVLNPWRDIPVLRPAQFSLEAGAA